MDIDALKASPIGRAEPIKVPEPGSLEATKPYWAFVPDPLEDEPRISLAALNMATKAAMALARLDQAVAQLPVPQLIIRPILRREATSTSALEGTYAEFDAVLEADFLEDRQMSSEQREIQNYVRATEIAVDAIVTRPVSRRLIGELQEVIVRGTDGETYDAGDLRLRQVYIGPKNRPVEEARFVPVPPGDLLETGFSDWEKWLNRENDIPIVAKMAMGHYQFETLHPYADGNGRLGRLITMLQLLDHKVLALPSLNLSPWFEARKDQYQDGLLRVTHTGDFDTWIAFFSEGVRAQAEAGVQTIDDLIAFRDSTVAYLRASGTRGVALEIAENLIGYPIIDVNTARQMTGKTYEAANQAIARLVEHGILREITGRPQNRLFMCSEVLRLIRR